MSFTQFVRSFMGSSAEEVKTEDGVETMATDMNNVTMEDIHIKSEEVKQEETRMEVTPVANSTLPFPREVRNRIYKFLLQSDYARVPATNGDRPTYRFYTEILRVSRQVYEEAKQVLYTTNTFIMVSHRWKNISIDLRPLGVPIVTDKHVSALKEHDLRIHVEWPKGKMSCQCCAHAEQDPLGSYLIVADDLPHFCRMLRVINFRIVGDGVVVKSARNEKPMRWHKGRDNIKTITKIQLRSTSYGSQSLEKQMTLLEPFKDVLGVAQKVIFGEVEPTLAQEVATKMMPRVVWSYAMGWNLLPLLKSWKDDIDLTVRAGNYELAVYKYHMLIRVSETTIMPKEPAPTFIDKCPSKDWENGLRFLIYDCHVTCGHIGLKLGKIHLASPHILELIDPSISGKLLHLPSETIDKALHLSVILMAETVGQAPTLKMLSGAFKRFLPFEPDILLAHGIAASRIATVGAILHDLDIAEKYADATKESKRCRPAAPPLTFANSSLNTASIEPFNTPWSGKCPEGLVGWEDTMHQLSKKDLKVLGLKAETTR